MYRDNAICNIITVLLKRRGTQQTHKKRVNKPTGGIFQCTDSNSTINRRNKCSSRLLHKSNTNQRNYDNLFVICLVQRDHDLEQLFSNHKITKSLWKELKEDRGSLFSWRKSFLDKQLPQEVNCTLSSSCIVTIQLGKVVDKVEKCEFLLDKLHVNQPWFSVQLQECVHRPRCAQPRFG